MKFTTNTKPLADALNLGIINANVSNYYKRSTVVQLTADSNTLRINIQASMVCTELQLKGSGEGEPATMLVDSLLFKQLINTLESSTVTLSFEEGGLLIHSGKSTFTIPQELDLTEIELDAPIHPESFEGAIDIDKSDWKFIKDYQLYAIATGFLHPVYTKVWVGENGDVLVGNIDLGRFTHSNKSKLGNRCLLSDTIVNLFTALPDNTKLLKVDRDYVLQFASDSYVYLTQFTPQYESDEGVGDYSAPILLQVMAVPDTSLEIPVAPTVKLLNQALLLSTDSEDTITLSVESGVATLKNKNVDGQIKCEGDTSIKFEVEFKLDRLKEDIGNYTDEFIEIQSRADADDPNKVAGILMWNNDLVTLVPGVE